MDPKEIVDRLRSAFQDGSDQRMLDVLPDAATYIVKGLDAAFADNDERMLTYCVPQIASLIERMEATRAG